jgi:hypothetical protein
MSEDRHIKALQDVRTNGVRRAPAQAVWARLEQFSSVREPWQWFVWQADGAYLPLEQSSAKE